MIKYLALLFCFGSLEVNAYSLITCHYEKHAGAWYYSFGGLSRREPLFTGNPIQMNAIYSVGYHPDFGICGQLTPTGNPLEFLAEVKTFSFTGTYPECYYIGSLSGNQLIGNAKKVLTPGGFVQGFINVPELPDVAQTLYVPTLQENSILMEETDAASDLWKQICVSFTPI